MRLQDLPIKFNQLGIFCFKQKSSPWITDVNQYSPRSLLATQLQKEFFFWGGGHLFGGMFPYHFHLPFITILH